jgi:Tol biopolymer transport system component
MRPHIPIASKLPALLLLLATAACADEGVTSVRTDSALGEARLGAGPPGGFVFHSDRAGNREIFLMDPRGADPVRLTTHPAGDFYPDIARDGRRVVFTSTRAAPSDIFLLDTRGGDPVNLTNTPGVSEDWARWSPEGRRVAFHSNRTGNTEIFVLDLRDGNLSQITNHPGPDMWPEWSPDGHRLSFRRDMDVYTIDLRDQTTTRLTHLPTTLDQMASWSRDGRYLAFMSFREGYCSVFRMDADGANQVNLTPKGAGDANNTWCSRSPSWTRHGQILFMSFRPSTGGDIEVFAMKPDGSGLVRLTHMPGEDGGPTAK